jgi:hypothetical protein
MLGMAFEQRSAQIRSPAWCSSPKTRAEPGAPVPDINLISITPSQLNGTGESGQYDTSAFEKIYLAQGDSWFSIGHFPPWATTNLLQQMVLSRSALAVNCARPGVELAHMTDTSSAQMFLNLLNGNISQRWDALLMSGGGNDLIDAATAAPTADPKLRLLLRSDEWPAAPVSASGYLSQAGWATFTGHMDLVLQGLLDQRDKGKNANVPLVLHCYDYVTPRNAPAGPKLGPWLYKAVNTIYHVPPADWQAVADVLISRLADMWLALAEKYASRNVNVIDTRGTITRAAAGTTGISGDWENEIHPTPHGYGLLARKWRPTLDALP